MKILNHFSTRQHLHLQQSAQVGSQMMMMLLFVLLVTTTVIQAVPTRILSSANNKLTGAAPPSATSIIPEEELELESLKGSSAPSQKSPLSRSGAAVATKKSENSTVKPVAYVKKPENEETPALSDNANSLKYGGANAELEEALANMAHIPPSKSPSLSVKAGGSSLPLGDSILQQQQKRTKDGVRGTGLLGKGLNLEVDYTPQDIAEYIFWMGDERGVELAINDFIQEGLITPQDAIHFLEDVKAELNSLRNRYASTVAQGRTSSSLGTSSSGNGMGNGVTDSLGFWEYPVRSLTKKQNLPASAPSSFFNSNNLLGSGYPSSSSFNPSSTSSAEQLNQYNYYPNGKSFGRNSNYWNGNSKDSMNNVATIPAVGGTSVEDVLDYEEIVEKLRQADTKLREVALEGIIYQLARELFTMGLTQSPGTSVPTFTTFIENLAVNGNISKDLERSVLETLVQALVDAANERGLLIAKSNEGQEGNSNKIAFTSKSSNAPGLGTSLQTKPIIVKKKST